MKPLSLSWVYLGCSPEVRAEIASGMHDEQFPNLRRAYLDYMSEEFLWDTIERLPTTGSVN